MAAGPRVHEVGGRVEQPDRSEAKEPNVEDQRMVLQQRAPLMGATAARFKNQKQGDLGETA